MIQHQLEMWSQPLLLLGLQESDPAEPGLQLRLPWWCRYSQQQQYQLEQCLLLCIFWNWQKLIRYRSGDIKFYQHVTDTYSFHRNVISSVSISKSFILCWLIFTQQYIYTIFLSFDTVFFTVTIDLDIRRLTISKFHSLFSLIVYMFSHFLFGFEIELWKANDVIRYYIL